MAGGDVGGGEGGGRKKHGKKKAKKRVSVRIDMTPMVDVAFLLLTFFMLTTVFRKPNTLEINLPPDKNAEVKMAESNLLTIRCDEQMNLYWSTGFDLPHKFKYQDLRKLLQEKVKENPKYVVVIKVDRKSKYRAMIDIVDELNLAGLGKFAFAPMTDIDKKEMSKAII
jgi:biopolymer transport protein ExbD